MKAPPLGVLSYQKNYCFQLCLRLSLDKQLVGGVAVPYRFGVGIAKVNRVIGTSLQRVSLAALCLVMVFTIAMR